MSLEGDERIIADAVLKKAAHMHDERRAAELNALSQNTGAHVANHVARLLAH